MRCPYCGREVNEGNKFCIGCGARLESQPVVSETAFNYQPDNNNKKNTGLIVTIIIISVLLIAGIIVGVILLTGGSKKDNNEENLTNNNEIERPDNGQKDIDNLSKNIKYTDHEIKDDGVLIEIENKNNIIVSVEATINYYDDNNKLIYTDNGYVFALDAGRKSAVMMLLPDESYKNYKIEIEAHEVSKFYTSHVKDIELDYEDNKEDEKIYIKAVNKSTAELDTLRIGAIFKKNGKVVAFDYENEYLVDGKEEVEFEIYYPYYDVEFDSFEIIIIDAYENSY